jgi:hypothetical protein
MASGYDVGVLITGDGAGLHNVAVVGDFNVAGIYVAESKGVKCNRVVVDGRNKSANRKVGRNELCPCGSQIKFKYCHGGQKMGRGIVSDNSEGTFTDATVVVDAGSIGIHSVNNDRTNYVRPNVYVGQEVDIERLIRDCKLPEDVPREFVSEAVEIVKSSKEEEPLKWSKLRMWLMTEKNLDARFVAESLVVLAASVLPGLVG